MKLTIDTERLILRPFAYSDATDVFNGWTSDDEVTKYLTWNTHESIDVTKKIIDLWVSQYEKPERINFAIVLKEENKLIGGIDVVGYIDGMPVIGYVLSRKYWGYGYMTEACQKVVELLFSLGHKIVRIDAVVDNLGSNKVIEKCGGVFIETYEDSFPMKNKIFKVNKYHVYQ